MKFRIRKTVAALFLMLALPCAVSGCGESGDQVLSLVSEETADLQAQSTDVTGEQETSPGEDSAGNTQVPETSAQADTASGAGDNLADPQETDETMAVYVCGAVASPGVYEVTGDMRLVDLVELAGGFVADADETYWNLAQRISDGAMYYVPTLSETADENFVLPDGESGEAGGRDTGETSASGGTAAGACDDTSGEQAQSDSSSDGLISINTATKEELTALPGIGDTKAAAIITYRETNGPFTAIDEIMNVTGIGESTYEKLKDYICL